MKQSFIRRTAIWVTMAFVCGVSSRATSIAPVTLADIFKQADQVVVVQVLSGTSESYQQTVYKAKVLTVFKGAKENEIIYFGPFLTRGVGSQYLLFLKKTAGLSPIHAEFPNYGDLPSYSREMYDGYASLEMDYQCVFDGQEIRDQCDYAVNLNPKQLIIPKSVAIFPRHNLGVETNYRGWVRKSVLMRQLEHLASANTNVQWRAPLQ